MKLKDGSFIVGGRSKKSKRVPVNSTVWRLDKNGNMLWNNPWTGTARIENKDWHNEHVNDLVLNHSEDGIIAVGYTRLSGFKKPQKPDMMAWSIDLNGSQNWIQRYEISGVQSAEKIVNIFNKNYLLMGGSRYIEIDPDGKLIKIHN